MDKKRVYQAIESREFEVYLQPQITLVTGAIDGAEALIRWKSPEGGYIYPDQFIPWCEIHNIIQDIDKFVLETMCIYIRRCLDNQQFVPVIGVNISRKTVCDRRFPSWCEELFSKYHLIPSHVELEITETAQIDNMEQMIAGIKTLKQNGFSISMDDFGEGYASLRMLQLIPVDSIKLDKSFFETIPYVRKSRILIASIIQMAKQLNVKVIAEGIENCDQLHFLQQVGCDKVQGYLFAKPLSIEQYENYQSTYQRCNFLEGE